MTESPRSSGVSPRDALVLGVSAIVVIAGAATASRDPVAPAPAAVSATAIAGPRALPSGAPPRGMEELPDDEERDTGCHFPDRGFADYESWRPLPLGKVLIPQGRAVDGDGSFRLLIHFHGAEPVRRTLAPEGFDLVIAAVDAGVGSRAYEQAMGPGAFEQLVAQIEREVAAANRLPTARARAIALSSWSAGYGAISQVLPGVPLTRGEAPDAPARERVAAVVLLDSLYAGYASGKRTLEHGQLPTFLKAAEAAKRGDFTLFLTHTAIRTPDYASTGEVASFLLAELGVEASPIDATPTLENPRPLQRMFEEGHLWIRGYAGADRDAHCAHLHFLPDIVREAVMPALR